MNQKSRHHHRPFVGFEDTVDIVSAGSGDDGGESPSLDSLDVAGVGCPAKKETPLYRAIQRWHGALSATAVRRLREVF